MRRFCFAVANLSASGFHVTRHGRRHLHPQGTVRHVGSGGTNTWRWKGITVGAHRGPTSTQTVISSLSVPDTSVRGSIVARGAELQTARSSPLASNPTVALIQQIHSHPGQREAHRRHPQVSDGVPMITQTAPKLVCPEKPRARSGLGGTRSELRVGSKRGKTASPTL